MEIHSSEESRRYVEEQLAKGIHKDAGEVIESLISQVRQKEEITPAPGGPHRISRGKFAHLNVPVTPEEVEEASEEACRYFPREFP